MKFLLTSMAVFVLLFSCTGKKAESGQNQFTVNFEKSSYEQALVKAKQQNKMLLADFYSDT